MKVYNKLYNLFDIVSMDYGQIYSSLNKFYHSKLELLNVLLELSEMECDTSFDEDDIERSIANIDMNISTFLEALAIHEARVFVDICTNEVCLN